MSDERIRNEFGDLGRQARRADPEPSLARLHRSSASARPAPRWWRALAAAAVVIVAVGVVAFATRGPGEGGEVAATTDQSTSTTTPVAVAPEETAPPEEVPATSLPSTDVTTIPLQTTTTTTDPFEGRRPVFAGEGWRVVDVAADDVLNVRSGPSAADEIVGTYGPNAEDVSLNGFGSTDSDGHGWWGVTLADGTEGFVNRAFLAPPISWVADVPAEMCGREETPDFGQDGGEQVDVDDQPDTILGLARIEGEQCDRYVIVLGVTDAETLTAVPVASFNAAGTDVVSVDDGAVVLLPPWLTEVVQTATLDRFGSTLAVVAALEPPVEEAPLQLRLLGSHDDVALSFRANPARIIVDLIGTDDDSPPTWIPGEGFTLLAGPPVVGGQDAQLEITGFARWFEAQGLLRITAADGSAVVADAWGPSVTGEFPDGFVGVYASWLPTYGTFRVFVDGLESGAYRLFVGEECGGDTAELCGVDTTFVIP